MSEIRHLLPCAGVFFLAGVNCASAAKESPSPEMRTIAAAQERSQEALGRAEQAQNDATKAVEKAVAAQANVQRDEDKLSYDQGIARQMAAKAQQAQTLATQKTRQATRETLRLQAKASETLASETKRVAKGIQMADGLVTRTRPDQVVIQPPTGDTMSFVIGKETRVRIEGRKSSAYKIREGTEARVAYVPSADGAKAVSIVVRSASL
ncbi:MAG TPA: hypothetical protein VMK12_28175 [Anaeromyxobacteraceae bacterium]|nr:hypothetical protein [Anaeromyxobacteraceae bacterium]